MNAGKSLSILSVAYPFAPVTQDPVGGAEQILARLDRAIVAAGHRSIVIAQAGSAVAGELRPVSRTGREIGESARAAVHQEVRHFVEQIIDRDSPDLIHFHGLDFADYLPDAGPPRLVTLHLPLAWYGAAALRPRPRTWFQPVSASQARTGPADVELLEPIDNGVPTTGSPLEKSDFALTLGRICAEKSVHEAIDAARSADARLLVAGNVFPYAEHRRYWREAVRPRLDRARRWIGEIAGERKRRLLARAQCVLVPSRAPETSSLVAMEALAAGTPVIAFPSGALPDIVEDGRTGFIVEDAREMGSAIRAAAQLKPEDCRAAARERFPVERMTARYLQRYQELAA